MKNFVSKNNAIRRQFNGVDIDVMALGKDMMLAKMLFKESDIVPLHKHPNEQIGYVISGKYKLNVDDQQYDLEAGDSYSVPENVEHSLEIIKVGEIIDVFSPIRQDYL